MRINESFYKGIPGVGYYYGGISQRKSQLTVLIASALSISIVSFQVSCLEYEGFAYSKNFYFIFSATSGFSGVFLLHSVRQVNYL